MAAKPLLIITIFSALAGMAMADHHLAAQVYVVHGIPGQDLSGMRPPLCLAQEVAQQLGCSTLLFCPLPADQGL